MAAWRKTPGRKKEFVFALGGVVEEVVQMNVNVYVCFSEIFAVCRPRSLCLKGCLS
jgi:hypothetical protein